MSDSSPYFWLPAGLTYRWGLGWDEGCGTGSQREGEHVVPTSRVPQQAAPWAEGHSSCHPVRQPFPLTSLLPVPTAFFLRLFRASGCRELQGAALSLVASPPCPLLCQETLIRNYPHLGVLSFPARALTHRDGYSLCGSSQLTAGYASMAHTH